MRQRVLLLPLCLLAVIVSLMLLASCMDSTSSLSELEVGNEIFRLVNEQRAQAGMGELTRNPALDQLAEQYSESGFSQEVRESSSILYLLSNTWQVTFTGAPYLKETTPQRQVDYCLEKVDLREKVFRDDATEMGIAVVTIGDSIYYTQIFDVLNVVGAQGEPIRLYDNSEAVDPSWEQLKAFILNDDTDQWPYRPDAFVCSDFAAQVHNRAEAAGIKAAYVCLDLDSGGHALNAFNTTDHGLVYIDCTGQGLAGTTVAGTLDGPEDSTPDYDKVAYLSLWCDYGLLTLDVASSFDYEFYLSWIQVWDRYQEKTKDYHLKVDAYEEARAGRTIISDPVEYEKLKQMLDELEGMRAELQSQRDVMGGYKWNSLGIVTRFYVHW